MMWRGANGGGTHTNRAAYMKDTFHYTEPNLGQPGIGVFGLMH